MPPKYQVKFKVQRLLADTVTPLGLYRALREKFPGTVLLESGDYLPNEGCFSYLAFDPIAQLTVQNEAIVLNFPDGSKVEQAISERGQVAESVKRFTQAFEIVDAPALQGLSNGFFGYFSFDCVRYFDELTLGAAPEAARAVPDVSLRLFRFVLAINHYKNELFIIENEVSAAAPATYSAEDLQSIIHSYSPPRERFQIKGAEQGNLTDAQLIQIINRCKEHIQRGDVFQIVPSRRFSQPYSGDDLSVYRALRSINPSPYLFYFDFDGFRIFGSSPEAHLVVKDGKASIFPIAGTYRRTGNQAVDEQAVADLQADPKENSEHVMLVDLARNDLSKHCEGVHVEVFKEIKLYSHVIHITSKVTGTLTPDTTAMDLFVDTFPMGTLSGAPKFRALQIIDELEGSRRGPYAGAIGCLGFDGSANFAIVIRSFYSKQDTLYYQVGAGIVAESDPATEVAEMNSKIAALRAAVKKAEEIDR